MNASDYFSITAIVIATISLILQFIESRNAVSREFVKSQVELVTKLIEILNQTTIEISFANFKKDGYSAGVYDSNIFEIEFLKIIEKDSDFYETEILFTSKCNRLLNLTPFLNNPHLPRTIAIELEKFFVRRTSKLGYSTLSGKKAVIINSKYYENDPYDNYQLTEAVVARSSDAFALVSFENLKACSILLKTAIHQWITSNNIKDVNLSLLRIQ